MLREELRRRLLEDRGISVTECCDECGQQLRPVRYARPGEAGVWCSRECRGIVEQPAIRSGGRPRKYRNGEERRAAKRKQQRDYRNGLSVEKSSQNLPETKDLQAKESPLSHYHMTAASQGVKSPLCENGSVGV